MSTAHSKLLSEICDWLRKAGVWYVRTNSHGYGRKGIPDVLACYQGRFVAIEAKVAPDKPTPWQERELNAIRAAGGKALVIYNMTELGLLWTPQLILTSATAGEEMDIEPGEFRVFPKTRT